MGFERVSVILSPAPGRGEGTKQSGFFDVEEDIARLSGLGNHLEAFS